MSEPEDPIDKFLLWYDDAKQNEPDLPTAVALATATPDGIPSARMVLLKGVDQDGFVFYSNTESRKGDELNLNPRAALCFHWKSLGRQVRVEGSVVPVTAEEADAYFASRAKDSKIGAWASKQSRPMSGRFDLEKSVAKYAAKYALTEVPRPPFWSGYRIKPTRIEFWREKPFRLHDRLVYSRDEPDGGAKWQTENLFP